MKKLLILITLLLSLMNGAHAQTLTAKSMRHLLDKIESSNFVYKEKGRLFGYMTIESCLFVSPDIAIFKNYCFPERKYQARGFTVISKEFGIIDLYQEKIPGLIKREFVITEFPEISAPYLSIPFPLATLKDLDSVMEKLYRQFNPGCWSTNYSDYTHSEDVGCSKDIESIKGIEDWAIETQAITSDLETWNSVMNKIDRKLIR